MKTLTINKLKMLQFAVLNSNCNISHFITTRSGGYSQDAYSSFNISPYCGDNPTHVLQNKELLLNALPQRLEHLILPHQTHGDTTKIIDAEFQIGRASCRESVSPAVSLMVRGGCS